MRALTAIELLGVWEQGTNQLPVRQGLLLLAAASPESSIEELGQLNVGQRDERLLTLREWTFGPQMAGLADCPNCGQRTELTLGVGDLRSLDPHASVHTDLELTLDEHPVRFRPPNSEDLLAVATIADVDTCRSQLVSRCGVPAIERLAPHTLEKIGEEMARAVPLADLWLAMTCPACHHAWQAPFDILSFFWQEIRGWASVLLRDVHTLAAAYGWSEIDILSMSPLRRRVYLEMATG